jgi:hypothetical protein
MYIALSRIGLSDLMIGFYRINFRIVAKKKYSQTVLKGRECNSTQLVDSMSR